MAEIPFLYNETFIHTTDAFDLKKDILYDRNTLYRLIVQKYNMFSSQTRSTAMDVSLQFPVIANVLSFGGKICSRNNKNAL